MDRSRRQNINKDIGYLSNKIIRLELMDMYRIIHPIKAEYAFFLSGTFRKIDDLLGCK